jgi:hypothetical protein
MAATYATGELVEVGDIVDFDGTPGTVLEVMDTPEAMAGWLTEPCVLFDTKRDGQLLQSTLDSGWNEVVFLSRRMPPA